ncbi:MAG: ribosome small subunit-dependent GTPase A [Bacteroidales bacterium]|jgi:ribosome biogenesis GTPase|nr:ribosome small subunit-dependent GTPase A [Bacteroidales bacterium]HOD27066.1 ribosome small subunit-dependent GTPase A [Bacteroidales bacterium]HPH57588.1 ribosome small subunit-dependent GTPase A [Bacteroidales bacterium]HPY58800.1 ribosome small subunit-dependent GTPase A [Bacteroidales bacterium]HQM93406.1 ribosome small subunit-dependent GTPase A [Bacteroidales bacterium]
MEGLVIKTAGNVFLVKTLAGDLHECVVKGNFRIKDLSSTNPVAIGDRVLIEKTSDDQTYFITEVLDRSNFIVRKAANLSKQLHILAANIDLAILMVTVNHPQTHTIFVDRFLATAEAYRIPCCLLFNKIDLYGAEDSEYLEALIRLYESIPYPCLKVSALKGEGIEEVRSLIRGKICLLAGNSGVGKSSLVNRLNPHIQTKVGPISDYHNKGRHITSYSEMFEIEEETYIIDTPGIKGFNTVDMHVAEVGHFFPEIFRTSARCYYNDCTHRHEPDCAVLKAIEEHRISQSRYLSYLSIIEDAGDGKYRE